MIYLQETHSTRKDRLKSQIERWKNICNANENQTQAGLATHTINTIDFKSKGVNREDHYKIMKGSVEWRI